MEWHECPVTALAESADPTCATPLAPSDLILRIVKRVNFVRIHASAENIGFTFGNMATVQLEPLQKSEGTTVCFSYQMLARAMAHEFGHALLGPEHSSQGIMRACWGEEQLSSPAPTIWSLLLTRKRRCALRSRHAMLENQRFPKQIPRSLRLARKDEKARLGLFTSATETTIYPEVAGFLRFKYF